MLASFKNGTEVDKIQRRNAGYMLRKIDSMCLYAAVNNYQKLILVPSEENIDIPFPLHSMLNIPTLSAAACPSSIREFTRF